MTLGGYFFTLEMMDYCIVNTNNPYECNRLSDKNDPKYNEDIFPNKYLSTLTDLNTGKYSTEFTIPKVGWITINIYQIISNFFPLKYKKIKKMVD